MNKKPQSSPAATSRRRFLRHSTLGAMALTIIPRHVLGGRGYVAPSDKITLGFIGTGKQSGGLGRRFLEIPECQMVAACDVFEGKLQRFQKQVNAHYAEANGAGSYDGCQGYKEYEALIARDDLDAVIVCLPDHWHAPVAIAAMAAGKDVYCEKPMAHTVAEGRAMVNATRKYDRVFQTGSMQRSWDDFRQAVELVRNGYLGELTSVKVNVGDPAVTDDLPDESTPAGLDWDRWLGPAPQRGYSAVLAPPLSDDGWPMWRRYAEYGGGILSDWGAHMFDIAQWGLGMDESGPVEFIPPTEAGATRGLRMVYANGVEMTHEDFGRGWAVQFNGTEGKIEVSRSFLESDIPGLVERTIGDSEIRVYKSTDHYRDWLDAIRNRTRPICDVEVGHRSASVCNLANIAYQLKRPLRWNPKKEKFKGDKEANGLLVKTYRQPYGL
ncbi:MAG: gfo/Idh/MocA family oxidoreductase [Bacteroidetes bacterium]|nr:MAG: gfo/Idh/MocA family oxidoreductase [Bacteroidota bacterium]